MQRAKSPAVLLGSNPLNNKYILFVIDSEVRLVTPSLPTKKKPYKVKEADRKRKKIKDKKKKKKDVPLFQCLLAPNGENPQETFLKLNTFDCHIESKTA